MPLGIRETKETNDAIKRKEKLKSLTIKMNLNQYVGRFVTQCSSLLHPLSFRNFGMIK